MADRAPGSPVLAHGALEGRNVVNGVHASFLLAKGGGYTGHTRQVGGANGCEG